MEHWLNYSIRLTVELDTLLHIATLDCSLVILDEIHAVVALLPFVVTCITQNLGLADSAQQTNQLVGVDGLESGGDDTASVWNAWN